VTLVASTATPVAMMLMLGGLRQSLARRYLDSSHDLYYHLHTTRVLSNPCGRIMGPDPLMAVELVAIVLASIFMLIGLLGVLPGATNTSQAPVLLMYLLTVVIFFFWKFRSLINHFNGFFQGMSVLQANIIHTRENAEAVAMLLGGAAERTRAWEILDRSFKCGLDYRIGKHGLAFWNEALCNYVWDILNEGLLGRAMLQVGAPVAELVVAKELLLQAKDHVA